MTGRLVPAALALVLASALALPGAAQEASDTHLKAHVHDAAAASASKSETKGETESTVTLEGNFDPATKVEGQVLQVVFGERAVFTLGAEGLPVLVAAEKGQLAVAHKEGAVTETFTAPEKGQLAVALDGSAEKQASYLRIWNSLDYPVAYQAILVTLRAGKLVARPAKVCAAPAKGARYEIWPQPVVAVALSRFSRAASAQACG